MNGQKYDLANKDQMLAYNRYGLFFLNYFQFSPTILVWETLRRYNRQTLTT